MATDLLLPACAGPVPFACPGCGDVVMLDAEFVRRVAGVLRTWRCSFCTALEREGAVLTELNGHAMQDVTPDPLPDRLARVVRERVAYHYLREMVAAGGEVEAHCREALRQALHEAARVARQLGQEYAAAAGAMDRDRRASAGEAAEECRAAIACERVARRIEALLG